MDNSNEDKMHTIWRQNGDNEAMKWYLDDGLAIWVMIQFLSMDNVILQYLYKKWKTEESEIIEKYRGDRPW